jgi:DNA-binding NtrC family response regulator
MPRRITIDKETEKRRHDVAESILNGKSILAVDDEPDVLTVLEAEIKDACPDCTIEKATTYETAADLLKDKAYDIVILDIMGVRGFDLLKIAVDKGLKAVMLTAKAMTPEALRDAHDMGARSFLPKDKLGEIVLFLEDVLKYEPKAGWARLLEQLEEYFYNRFENDWRKKYPFSYY